MRGKGFLVGCLLLYCGLTSRGQEQAGIDLKAELEALRKERDVLESRLRIAQDELEEARRTAVNARLEIDVLEANCRKLQEELKQLRGTQLNKILRNVVPNANGTLRGRITAMSANLRTMQISIGEDAGLKEGQVLDVIRMPSGGGGGQPLYLGTVRVTRVDGSAAVGQYERVPALDRMPRVGDEVTNELSGK